MSDQIGQLKGSKMSMINRYKKPGGFLQLLNLMETCGPAKQENFMKLIEAEDPRWAEAIKSKMITIKRIFSWDDNTVAEITSRLNDLSLSTLLFGMDDPTKEKIFKMMDHGRKRKIDDLVATKKPTPAEVSTIYMQTLTEVRKMIDQGYLYLDKIDSALVVDKNIEEKLNNSTLYELGHDVKAGPAAHGGHAMAQELKAGASPAEIEAVKKKLHLLVSENNQLKEKLIAAENRLAQIRKIA